MSRTARNKKKKKEKKFTYQMPDGTMISTYASTSIPCILLKAQIQFQIDFRVTDSSIAAGAKEQRKPGLESASRLGYIL